MGIETETEIIAWNPGHTLSSEIFTDSPWNSVCLFYKVGFLKEMRPENKDMDCWRLDQSEIQKVSFEKCNLCFFRFFLLVENANIHPFFYFSVCHSRKGKEGFGLSTLIVTCPCLSLKRGDSGPSVSEGHLWGHLGPVVRAAAAATPWPCFPSPWQLVNKWFEGESEVHRVPGVVLLPPHRQSCFWLFSKAAVSGKSQRRQGLPLAHRLSCCWLSPGGRGWGRKISS